MTTLRWILGIPTFLAAGGWLLLAAWGDSFRRSWGASENSGFLVFGPFLAMAALLATLLFPQQKPLLHAVASGVVLLAVASCMLLPRAPGLAVTILAYCALWFCYYHMAAWPPEEVKATAPVAPA
jgi:hypothetical protein